MRRALKIAVGSLGASAALAVGAAAPASAGHLSTPCGQGGGAEGQIAQAIKELTGITPVGYACNPGNYDYGFSGTTYEAVKTDVASRLNRCNNGADKLLTLAVMTLTNEPPVGNVCTRAIYEDYGYDTYQGFSGVNWNQYGEIDSINRVYGIVSATLHSCSELSISQAVIQVTGGYPVTDGANMRPPALPTIGTQAIGQCNRGLYNNGAWDSYESLVELVTVRRNSTQRNCANPAISTAIRQMTLWNPLPEECNAVRYGGGNWNNDDATLRNMIFGHWDCVSPSVGAAYVMRLGRLPRGASNTGECNFHLYQPANSTSLTPQQLYAATYNNVGALSTALTNANATISGSGKLRLNGGALEIPTAEWLIRNPAAGVISTGGGNVISTGGGNVIGTGGLNVIATGGGNIQIFPKAELISDKGLGLIGQAGGNFGGMPSGGAALTHAYRG